MREMLCGFLVLLFCCAIVALFILVITKWPIVGFITMGILISFLCKVIGEFLKVALLSGGRK